LSGDMTSRSNRRDFFIGESAALFSYLTLAFDFSSRLVNRLLTRKIDFGYDTALGIWH